MAKVFVILDSNVLNITIFQFQKIDPTFLILPLGARQIVLCGFGP